MSPYLVVAAAIAFAAASVVKAPPDTMHIISGPRGQRTLTGKSGIRIPVLERKDTLYLGEVTINISPEKAPPAKDGVFVSVDAVAKVCVTSAADGIALATRNLLNKSPRRIAVDLERTLLGVVCETVAAFSYADICADRNGFSECAAARIANITAKLGLEIVSFAVVSVEAAEEKATDG